MTNFNPQNPNYTSTSIINPIYNISQFIQLTKYLSHPSIYPLLHNKQIAFNYILHQPSNNLLFTKHHQNINSLLNSQPIQNNNFSPPPLTIQLSQSQPTQPQPQQSVLPQPTQSQPQPTEVPQPTQPQPTQDYPQPPV